MTQSWKELPAMPHGVSHAKPAWAAGTARSLWNAVEKGPRERVFSWALEGGLGVNQESQRWVARAWSNQGSKDSGNRYVNTQEGHEIDSTSRESQKNGSEVQPFQIGSERRSELFKDVQDEQRNRTRTSFGSALGSSRGL